MTNAPTANIIDLVMLNLPAQLSERLRLQKESLHTRSEFTSVITSDDSGSRTSAKATPKPQAQQRNTSPPSKLKSDNYSSGRWPCPRSWCRRPRAEPSA
jgi:hypothetical protein